MPRQITFPNPNDPPTRPPQVPVHHLIPRLVSRQFALPEGAIVLWLGRVLGTAVPETTVHEHREFEFGEHEIRPDGELRVEG